MADFDEKKAISELELNGYTVIENVLSNQDCDEYVSQYKAWLSKFGDKWPDTIKALVHSYHVGHFEPTWAIRLKAKPAFAKIWQTEKLLSSFDAVSISKPPELSNEKTSDRNPEDNWFHVDQGGMRKGLHIYQGAVYLEETSESDLCFRVLKGSHKHLAEFYRIHPDAKNSSNGEYGLEQYRLRPGEKEWFIERGCQPTLIPVPKGGLVLWDSREVHDNVRPLAKREHSDRWRFVVFVCMGPAIWATEKDLLTKRQAYEQLNTTAHWPSQGITSMIEKIPEEHKNLGVTLEKLPEIAMTREAKLLAGLEKYDFDDETSNGPGWEPEWEK